MTTRQDSTAGECFAKCVAWFGVLSLTFSFRAAAHEPSCRVAQLNLQAYEAAIEEYAVVHGSLPNERGWINALIRDRLIIAAAHATDPWGNAYDYRVVDGSFDLRTVGADGVFGELRTSNVFMADAGRHVFRGNA